MRHQNRRVIWFGASKSDPARAAEKQKEKLRGRSVYKQVTPLGFKNLLRNQAAAVFRRREEEAPLRWARRRGRRALSISAIMRASIKARGEAKAISCVRSYSNMSRSHSSSVN